MRVDKRRLSEPTHEGNHGDFFVCPAWHGTQRVAQGAAPTNADRQSILELRAQILPSRIADHERCLVRVKGGWHHNGMAKGKSLLELFFERNTVSQTPGDADLHQPLFPRQGEQSVDTDAAEAQLFSDLCLRIARHKIKPRCARCQLLFGIKPQSIIKHRLFVPDGWEFDDGKISACHAEPACGESFSRRYQAAHLL